jgi:hypothetical protein
MKRTILILLCVLLLLAEGAQAMSSASYQIDWSNLLSGSGGPASSAGFKVNFTVGQTVRGDSASSLYKVQMGYWAGADLPPTHRLYLPAIKRSP